MKPKKKRIFKRNLVFRKNRIQLDMRYSRNRQWLEQIKKENQLPLPF